jgi:hypothetical protein
MDRPTRWTHVLDILEDGALYTEDAERLVLAGVRMPADQMERAKAFHELAELVHDKVMFYTVVREGPRGVLEAEIWVDDVHVNSVLREKGYR